MLTLENINIKPINTNYIEIIQNHCKCSYLTALIMSNRIEDFSYESIENFINPDIKNNWIDTNLIPNIEILFNKIKEIIEKKETVGIIGDYDVDGLTSATMLIEFFENFNIKTEIWIPSRTEGYGPNIKAANFFNEKGIETVFTLDCGTTAYEFEEYFHGKIIVIDHHPATETIKGIVVNPNYRKEFCTIDTLKELSAAGLTFFVITHILKKINHNHYQEILNSFLDLVALSTVCDMMPINSLNKILIKKGLNKLSEQKRIGLSRLINLANIKLPVTARDIGFSIGPRLNAAGRIESPKISLDLLLAKNAEQANEIIYKIEQTNNYRRELQSQIFQEAIIAAKQDKNSIICLASNDWNLGVVGIVAAMIQNEINKPVIIANINENIVKGSARSNSVNIGMLIEKAVELNILDTGGGHSAAAGLSCSLEQWDNFKIWINKQPIEINKEIIPIDAITTLEAINNDYKIIAPFGINNPNPIVMVENLNISKIFDKSSYFHLIINENFKPYTFFINHNQKELLENLMDAQKNLKNFKAIIELSEKNMNLKYII